MIDILILNHHRFYRNNTKIEKLQWLYFLINSMRIILLFVRILFLSHLEGHHPKSAIATGNHKKILKHIDV